MLMVLSTGMSGTGKSTALQVLGLRGHRIVDTDIDRWCHWVTVPDGSSDRVWREQAKWRARVPSQAVPSGLMGASRPAVPTSSRGPLARRPNVLSVFHCGWMGGGESLGR